MTTTTPTTLIDIVKSHKIVKAKIAKNGDKKYILDNGWVFIIGSDKLIIETQNDFFYCAEINGEWKYLGKKTKDLV